MKIIDKGLVGKRLKCPLCQCVFELESADTWTEGEGHSTALSPPCDQIFSVPCPQCTHDVLVAERRWVPPPPHGRGPAESWTPFQYPNFVEFIAA